MPHNIDLFDHISHPFSHPADPNHLKGERVDTETHLKGMGTAFAFAIILTPFTLGLSLVGFYYLAHNRKISSLNCLEKEGVPGKVDGLAQDRINGVDNSNKKNEFKDESDQDPVSEDKPPLISDYKLPSEYNPENFSVSHYDINKIVNDRIGPLVSNEHKPLNEDYLYLNCLGGGNCFYYAFLGSWLHHLVWVANENQENTAIDKTIAKFLDDKDFNDYVDSLNDYNNSPYDPRKNPEFILRSRTFMISVLADLAENPSTETVTRLIRENSNNLNKITFFLRLYTSLKMRKTVPANYRSVQASLAAGGVYADMALQMVRKAQKIKESFPNCELGNTEDDAQADMQWALWNSNPNKAWELFCEVQGTPGVETMIYPQLAISEHICPIYVQCSRETQGAMYLYQQYERDGTNKGVSLLPDGPMPANDHRPVIYHPKGHFDALVPRK